MDKSTIKAFYFSAIFHLFVILIFALFLIIPDFNQKIEFKPIEIKIKRSNIFGGLNYQTYFQSKDLVIENNVKQSIIKNDKEKNTLGAIDKSKIEKKQDNKITDSNKIIEEKTIKNENITSEVEKNEVMPSEKIDSQSVKGTESKEENDTDEIVQQILANQIEGGSDKGSKENIHWNNGANRYVIKKVKPVLPKKYQEKGVTITCKVYIEINKFGSVISVVIVQSTGYVELDQNIISVVKDWKFNQVTYDRIDSGYITFIFVVS